MRDSWLAVAGISISSSADGVSIFSNRSVEARRSVYAFIDRQDLPQLFRTFDFASPDVSTPQRPQTTIPQQALFAMNSPFPAVPGAGPGPHGRGETAGRDG